MIPVKYRCRWSCKNEYELLGKEVAFHQMIQSHVVSAKGYFAPFTVDEHTRRDRNWCVLLLLSQTIMPIIVPSLKLVRCTYTTSKIRHRDRILTHIHSWSNGNCGETEVLRVRRVPPVYGKFASRRCRHIMCWYATNKLDLPEYNRWVRRTYRTIA